jgi:uncharacterized membrane protein
MKKTNFIKESVILILLLAPVVFMLVVWNRLPDNLPLHWDIEGKIDRNGPKYVFALINICLYLLLIVIPKIDPRKKNYTIFSASYYKLRLIFTTFFSLLFFVVLYNAVYSGIEFDKMLPVSCLFLFAAIGNYFGIIRSNYFIGVRTPWTLNNDEVWKKTHLLAARLFVYGGILGGIICLFLDKPYSQCFAIAVFAVLILIPVVYSYVYYQKVVKNNSEC